MTLDPVWFDFVGKPKSNPVPFIAPLPVTLWVYPKDTCTYVLGHVSSLLSIQLNHHQYLFLMRLQELVNEMNAFLTADMERLCNGVSAEMCISVVLPQVDVSLLMNPTASDCGSPPFDTESVYPETASMSEFRVAALARFRESRSEHQFSTFSDNESLDFQPSKAIKESWIEAEGVQEVTPECTPELEVAPQSTKLDINETRKTIQFQLPKSDTFSSVKRGFASGFNQVFDTVLKITDEASDTLSIRSDNSDESDAFSLVMVDEKNSSDYLFCFNTDQETVEVADEVSEESSEQLSSVSSPKEAQMNFNGDTAKKMVSPFSYILIPTPVFSSFIILFHSYFS